MWRIDHRINAFGTNPPPIKRRMNEYLRNNFYITTSGNFCTPTLMNVIQWMGADRVMFSVDYPFERMTHAGQWFDGVDCDADWEKIARCNAIRLLKLQAGRGRGVSA
jgi:2,3-dihydroxybenzoate decarboxylase